MMTETETETVNDETPIKPGTLLKQKRESLGLTQKQIADKLRLRTTVVESLESNNFNIDKVSTFVRGYIRSYARLIGVDEPQILAAYDAFCGAEQQELSMTSFSNKTVRQQHNSRHNLITFGIILIVIGISSIWWYQSQKDDTLSPQNKSHTNPTVAKTPTTSSTSDDDFTTVSELTPTGDNASGVVSENEKQQGQHSSNRPKNENAQVSAEKADASNATSSPQHDQTSASQGTKAGKTTEVTTHRPDKSAGEKTPAVAVSKMSALSMSFQNDCWVQVKDADDQTIIVGLKKAGQKINLQGKAPFKLILGAPEGVSITFAGEPVDLSRYTSGKVARFTLP